MGKGKLVGRTELEMSQIVCKAGCEPGKGAGQWDEGTANGVKKIGFFFIPMGKRGNFFFQWGIFQWGKSRWVWS